jgi:serine/threonine-protein kinase
MLRTMSAAPGPVDALGLVGSTIDQVRFDACVDAGGFGLIYRGFHEGLGESVAIKCLRIAAIQHTNQQLRDALAGRFRDETKLLYRLSQGNLDIVRCISSGSVVAPRTREYTPYMVLEWLDGSTLSAELRERRRKRVPPRTLEEAVALLDPAAGGIAYAHAHDVVHRDIKPGNLFLTRTRGGVRMKVLDFGLAKILSDESIGVRPSVETGIGVQFCSPSYGAPEQYSAQMGKIGPATDVYSLALVLLEVLVGDKVRHAATLAEGLMKALEPKTGSPSASSLGLSLPPAVEALLLRAVAQSPLDRPRDAGAFWSALKQAMVAPLPTVTVAMVARTGEPAGGSAAPPRASLQPAPFTGTLLMQSAPLGAPHLGPSLPPGAPHPGAPAPSHAPDRPRDAEPPALSRATSPMRRPPSVPPPPGGDGASRGGAGAPLLRGTLPIGALSPFASSMAVEAVGKETPSAPPGPMPGDPPEPRPHVRPEAEGAPTVPMQSSATSLVFLVACVLIAVAGITFYLVSGRGP